MIYTNHIKLISKSTERIVKRVREFYELHIQAYELCAEENVKKIALKNIERQLQLTFISYMKIFVGIISLIFFKLNPEIRYIFHTLKHVELMKLLPSNEVMVFALRDELTKIKQLGYKSFISYGLNQNVIAAMTFNSFFLQLYTYIFYHKTKNNNILFFLHDDWTPIGAFLSMRHRSTSNKVIMIQHGYFSTLSLCLESNACDYYFLYDQKKVRPYISSEKVIELQLPIDVKVTKEFNKTIILVGTGDDTNKKSLSIFNKIWITLHDNYQVQYRPHPSEDFSYNSTIQFSRNHQSKKDCLSEDLKIFIGYESTLLYEAMLIGHVCIAISSKNITTIDYEVDYILDDEKIPDLRYTLEELVEKKWKLHSLGKYKFPSLKDRFLKALSLVA